MTDSERIQEARERAIVRLWVANSTPRTMCSSCALTRVTSGRTVGLCTRVSFLPIVTLVAAFASTAPASAGTICLPIVASGTGQDHGGGVTTADITTHGILLGTTRGTFTVTGVVGTTASFAGPIVFATRIGTLTAQVQGTLDLGTGAFRSESTSLTGTGLFKGVTGNVKLVGTENLATGAFIETITGRLRSGFPH